MGHGPRAIPGHGLASGQRDLAQLFPSVGFYWMPPNMRDRYGHFFGPFLALLLTGFTTGFSAGFFLNDDMIFPNTSGL